MLNDLCSEVTDINKQKFLTELGKLLTFMYEEDRQTALALYERMFDKAEDEMALLQLLVSPTRQAVIVARAYNAREHKLDVYTQSREAAPASNGEMPDFVRAINQIYLSAVDQHIIAPEVTSGQFTLFADDDSNLTETYAYDEDAYIPRGKAPAPAPVYAAAPEVPAQAPVQVTVPQAPVQTPAAPVREEVPEVAPMPVQAEPVPAPEAPAFIPAPVYPEVPEEVPAPEAEAPQAPEAGEPAPAPAAVDVDDFVAGFSLPEEAVLPEAPVSEEAPLLRLEDSPAEAVQPAEPKEPAPAPTGETLRKPKVFLLILYVLFAVPITLLGILLLLIPTLLCLALAVAVLGVGAAVLIAAFSGFKVFADIMVVLGVALIVLALGILLLWLFIWFIGGAMAGLVRGVCSLGGRWCYKEVPAV